VKCLAAKVPHGKSVGPEAVDNGGAPFLGCREGWVVPGESGIGYRP
jgi:hypothetical protein